MAAGDGARAVRSGAVHGHPQLLVPELHPARRRDGAAAARLARAAAGKPVAARLLCVRRAARGVRVPVADPEHDHSSERCLQKRCRGGERRADAGAAAVLLAGAARSAAQGGAAGAGRRRGRAAGVVCARVRTRRRALYGLDRADRHARGLCVHPAQPVPALRGARRGGLRHRAAAGARDGPVYRARARGGAGHRLHARVSLRRQLPDGLAARGHVRTDADGGDPAAAAGSRLSGGCAQRPHAGGHRRLRRRAARRGRGGGLSGQRRQNRVVGSLQREK